MVLPPTTTTDNDSAKQAAAVKTVKDIVNRGAKADAMQSIGTEVLKQGDEAEVEETQEVVAEQEVEETTEEPTLNIEEDLAALFGGEELSEQFQEKAKTIFEGAVTAKVNQVQEEMAKEYEETLCLSILKVLRPNS